MAFATLIFEEPVRLDPEALGTLHRQLGPAGAENVISRAMEELAGRMVQARRFYADGAYAELSKLARSLIAIGAQVGMTRFAKVARDVSVCAATGDPESTGATLARLERLGERSLLAMWDLQDMRI